MRGAIAQRVIVLAGIALLAAVVAYAASERSREDAAGLPEPAGSYVALAGSSEAAVGRRTACGVVIRARTLGVAHPVLPCGARLYVSYRGRHVLTQVIDRGPYAPGRQFELTPALARALGLTGVRRITWSYAAAR